MFFKTLDTRKLFEEDVSRLREVGYPDLWVNILSIIGFSLLQMCPTPSIRIDLIQHHNLSIDPRKRRFVDGNTKLSIE